MSGHLSVRDRVGRLLQLQDLEVHTLTLIREDEVGIKRALWPPRLFSVALSWHGVSVKAGSNRNVGNSGTAGSALDGDVRSLGFNPGGRDHDAGNFNEFRHLVTFQVSHAGPGFIAAESHVDILQVGLFVSRTCYLNRKMN